MRISIDRRIAERTILRMRHTEGREPTKDRGFYFTINTLYERWW